jgi:REP element-mobilizing transposase RayT
MAIATRLRTWSRGRGNRLPSTAYRQSCPIHVTVCTWRGTPYFHGTDLAVAGFRVVADHTDTLAACLLPDHLHWLISGGANLSARVGRFKSFSTKLARDLGLRERLWQRSFWDHVVRRGEGLEKVARYIVENPVRAGLVTEVSRYPYQIIRPEAIDNG